MHLKYIKIYNAFLKVNYLYLTLRTFICEQYKQELKMFEIFIFKVYCNGITLIARKCFKKI